MNCMTKRLGLLVLMSLLVPAPDPFVFAGDTDSSAVVSSVLDRNRNAGLAAKAMNDDELGQVSAGGFAFNQINIESRILVVNFNDLRSIGVGNVFVRTSRDIKFVKVGH